ncbi:MAG TPA: FG-GAP-like repeat-containing protein [Pyrinomonadaceae bacterium]|nr:FG-GAP-like repeat-containing protein [Pyrinomonadaceae bacterium]
MKTTLSQNLFSISILFTVLLAIAATSNAQLSQVDPTFNAVPSNALTGAMSHLVQPDGKVIVYGPKTVIDGVAADSFARLNSDGSRDPSFSYCDCALSTVTSARLLPDGKIVVAGSELVNGDGGGKIIRLNTDGSVDPTFRVFFSGGPGFNERFSVEAVQPDGKILAMRRSSGPGTNVSYGVYRFNTDGTQDASFTPFGVTSGSGFGASIRIALLPDGRFYIATTIGGSGSSGSPTLQRRNADGSIDSTWQAPSFSGDPNIPQSASLFDLAVAPDGGATVAGNFLRVNGLEKAGLVKLMPLGNVDLGFSLPPVTWASRVYTLPDGKTLFAGTISGVGSGIFRLNLNGSLDNTFAMDSAVQFVLSNFDVDSSQRIILFAQTTGGVRLVRLLPTGGLDGTFQTFIALYGRVYAMAMQSDGKILVAGVFSHMDTVSRNSLARVNADGSLDPTLDPGTGFNSPPEYLLPQADGKIIAAAGFATYRGASRPGLVRIMADGSLDAAFSPTLSVNGSVNAAALQSDGRILIAGSFSSVNGEVRTSIARLNADGSLDNTFNPIFGAANLTDIIQQPDGKIMVAGSFSGVNGFNRSSLVRLTITGELDQSFNANGATVDRVWLQPDGKYILTGTTLSRRNADGSPDSGFVPPTFTATGFNGGWISSVIVQADGSLVVGGRFDKVGTLTRRNIVRLNPTGGVDTLFLPTGADAEVRAMIAQSNGKVIIGGDFSKVETTARAGIARISTVPFRRPAPFDFDGDGRADISVVRPSTNRWYEALSSNGNVYEETFGSAGDVPVPADFDGDGTTDEAIYRPSNGQWWFRSSVSDGLVLNVYGLPEDIPRPSDFDGDGRADFVLYRPSNRTWYRVGSMNPQQQATPVQFGSPGDLPLVGDFDGDGRSDLAVFRPSTGDWWYSATSANGAFRKTHWGRNGDIPVPADYDGDGKTDFAVFRPSDGGWYIYNSGNGSFTILAFGTSGDRPVAADYDGDGRADIAVFRPSQGLWYLYRTTAGFAGYQFGISTDVAIPGSFIP